MIYDVKAHDIKNILSNIFRELSLESVDEDANLADILDSFSLIELMVKLEERFNITISADDFSSENFSSLNKLVSLILNKK